MKKSKNIVLFLSIFIFVIASGFTVSKAHSQSAFFGECEVCTATGCDPAIGPQKGVDNCTNKYDDNEELEGCKLGGSACDPEPE